MSGEVKPYKLRAEKVFRCSQCRAVTKWEDRNIIVESKQGRETGKVFNVCPKCNEKFYKAEIKAIKKEDITKETKAALHENADALDIKSYLETWSRPKT